MMMIEYAKRAVVDPNFWLNAVKTVGFPIVVAGAVLWIYDKDNARRQELFTKLVESQIKQGETTSATMVRTQDALEKLEKISDGQAKDHATLITAQKSALENHTMIMKNQTEIMSGISKDCDSTKELVGINKKIYESLESTRARPYPPPPAPSPAKANKST
jgi:hypothetical protein